MSKKREILELLTRDELLVALDAYEVDATDRRAKAGLVDALASSKKATIDKILEPMPRARLKELCSKLGLDGGGREKAVLIKRLTGVGPTTTAPAASRKSSRDSRKSNGNSRNGSSTPEFRANGKLTVENLERYLWSAADILRGSIDSSDYKNFIFGMLFLKRLSDVFDERVEALVAEGWSEKEARSDHDEHRFFVPENSSWSRIQKTATNIGEALNKACIALEESNPSLEGVLAGIDYNDERKLGDAKNRDTVLSRLVQHFSQVGLRNDSLAEPDMLGRAYEYLIEKFADDAGKKGGEFYTPNKVVRLIVEVLDPTERMRICDPTCGSGGMLVQCAHYVKGKGGNVHNLTLHGQEKNLGTWAICKMNMLLHGLPDARIEKGDTIRDPKLVQEGELILYDRVIANPPFSLDEWGREVAESDRYGRFRFGIPPKSKGDLAFLQHMVATLGMGGKLGIVLPHGVLFRGSAEGDIRKGLIEEDLVEAVIGLAPNLFYGTGIPACVLVLSRDKKPDHRGRVLFIFGADEMVHGTNQNTLSDANIEKMVGAYRQFADIDGFSRVVSLDEIRANDWNLNITRYVDVGDQPEAVDLEAELAKLHAVERERAQAEQTMKKALASIGYGSL